ncbi:MAG: hypothetical protein K2I00_05770 [Ruminococcus sp.]|nr:hypothetical protein [Ruminococcus sp.]
MKIKFITALSATIILSAVAVNSYAEDTTVYHTVTVYDFDGEVMDTLSVPHGESVDLGGINTDSLSTHDGNFTEIRFGQWSDYPESITEDTDIHALYVKMTISCDKIPSKTEYYSKTGNINTDGMKIIIQKDTQLPEKDKNGDFIVDEEIVDITQACIPSPFTVGSAFSKDTSAKISITPPKGNQPIVVYNISCFPELGDTDYDNLVSATDASDILIYYAQVSTGTFPEKTDDYSMRADIDRNGKIDASDASYALQYYAAASTTLSEINWDIFWKGLSVSK